MKTAEAMQRDVKIVKGEHKGKQGHVSAVHPPYDEILVGLETGLTWIKTSEAELIPLPKSEKTEDQQEETEEQPEQKESSSQKRRRKLKEKTA